MINTIIIDDENNGAEVLQLILEQHCPDVKIIAIENSAESGIRSILHLKPDLVFLDIEMPTATGFEVINATSSVNYEVVFTTAYEHYAIKAFKTKAVDYLLKPIDIDELKSSIERVKERLQSNNGHSLKQMSDIINNTIHKPKKISIPSQEGLIFIDTDNIIRLEAESNYTHVFLKDKRKITASKTLKHFEELLHNYNFCRVHSTHIVNLDKIERYIKGDGGFVVLQEEITIPVSRAYKIDLIRRIG